MKKALIQLARLMALGSFGTFSSYGAVAAHALAFDQALSGSDWLRGVEDVPSPLHARTCERKRSPTVLRQPSGRAVGVLSGTSS